MRHYRFPTGDSNGCNPDCRWTVLKDVLIGPAANPGGLLKQLEGEAELGLEMYSATDSNQGDGDNSFLPSPPTRSVRASTARRSTASPSSSTRSRPSTRCSVPRASTTTRRPALRSAPSSGSPLTAESAIRRASPRSPRRRRRCWCSSPMASRGSAVTTSPAIRPDGGHRRRPADVHARHPHVRHRDRRHERAGGAALQRRRDAGKGLDPATGDAGAIRRTPRSSSSTR